MLSDSTKRLPFGKGTEELWENNGWFFRGTGRDEEFLIWNATYLMKGNQQWFSFDGAHSFNQTLIIHGHFSAEERSKMHDNDFVVEGVHNPYLEARELCIRTHGSYSSWRLRHRTIEGRYPRYRVQEKRGNPRVSLSYEATSPPISLDGCTKKLTGFQILGKASGTVLISRRRYRVKGFGLYEKTRILGPTPLSAQDRYRMVYQTGFTSQVQISLQLNPLSPTKETSLVCLFFEGEPSDFSRGTVDLQELAYWYDPRAGFYVPCSWHLFMESARMTVDLYVVAYARGYYLWDYLQNGFMLLYWMMADANGIIKRRGKPPLQIEDMKYVAASDMWLPLG
jgi:hypothetical protein